ncbi:MAG: hypothetical protein GY756_01285 [bacterium]|nr:hypothetical protein [bacterium]
MENVSYERKPYILISDIYSSKNYLVKEIADNGFKIITFFSEINKYLRVKNSLDFEYVDYSIISNGCIMDNIRYVKKHLNANNGELKFCITESAPELSEQHFFISVSETANQPKRLSSMFAEQRKMKNNSKLSFGRIKNYHLNSKDKYINTNENQSDVIIGKFTPGTQYFIDTVTYHGKHHICGICKVVDNDFTGEKNLPKYWDFIHPYDSNIKNCISYIKGLLKNSGIEYGFVHSKVMIDLNGDFELVEFYPRIVGGEGTVSRVNKEFLGYDQPNMLCKLINSAKDIKLKEQSFFYRVVFLYSSNFSHKEIDKNKIETVESYHMHRRYVNYPKNELVDSNNVLNVTEVVLKNKIFEHLENDSKKLLEMTENSMSF